MITSMTWTFHPMTRRNDMAPSFSRCSWQKNWPPATSVWGSFPFWVSCNIIKAWVQILINSFWISVFNVEVWEIANLVRYWWAHLLYSWFLSILPIFIVENMALWKMGIPITNKMRCRPLSMTGTDFKQGFTLYKSNVFRKAKPRKCQVANWPPAGLLPGDAPRMASPC